MNQFSRRNFLKNSLVLSLGSIVLSQVSGFASGSVAQARRTMTQWKNWAGNIKFTPRYFFSPRTASELQRIILQSEQVRAVGSGHSFSALVPGRSLLSASHFNHIRINKSAFEVDVGSGVTLGVLNEELGKHGLSFATMGEISEQTVGGLIATATKGTGASFGSFSDEETLLGLEIVDGRGQILTVDFQDPDQAEKYKALRLNLGCFGVVTSVRFRVVPAFNLLERKVMSDLTQALKSEHYLNHYRYAFYYYPHGGQTVMRFQDKTTAPANVLSRRFRKFKNRLLENNLADAILNVAAHFPSKIPQVVNLFVSTMSNETFVDTGVQVMDTGIKVQYFEMQYSLPVENLQAALSECKTVTDDFASRGLYYADLPIFVRFTRGDRGGVISPSQGDGIFAHIDLNAHTAQKGYEAYFAVIEKQLINLGGRPHWGKLFYADLSRFYPQLADFENLRREMDPENKFLNDFVRQNVTANFT